MNLETNIDQSILENMSGANLASLIQDTPYQQASPDAVNPGVNLAHAGEPGVGQGVGQTGNVAEPGNQMVQPGVTTGPGPQVQQAEVERMRQIAFEAATAKIEAEEATFEAQLVANGFSDGEKEVARMQRQLEQTTAVNGWLNNRIQTTEQQQKAAQNQVAKNQRAYLVAQEFGLPINNEAVKATLMAARDPQHMRQIAEGVRQMAGQGQTQQARTQLNGGVFAAGGTSAGAAGPNLKQYERSGNIDSLIENRGYTTVNW